MIEWYIVDDWYGDGIIQPNNIGGGATKQGEFIVDGATYFIYKATRPAGSGNIEGSNNPFPQFFSIRQSRRQHGTISITEHFKKWQELGMVLGTNMYEAKFLVEAAGGTGYFDARLIQFYKSDDQTDSGGTPVVINNPVPSVYADNNTITTINSGTTVSVNNPSGTKNGTGFSYDFPANWSSYSKVIINYTLSITAGPAKVILKSGKNSWSGDIIQPGVENSQYKDFTGTGGTLLLQTAWFDSTKMGSPGISFQVNNNAGNNMVFTFKVNSITFE